ncbi:histidine ammonia-lyase [Apibacter raozihei]|uniref:histidine ammonia-lyase n=1 Tax=Apibacter raozihei TaxID=2500547 RepID=UPI000FE3D253|nr:histidine ammonia-lyase [Apibacter raozihei]
MKNLLLDGNHLTLEDVVAVSRHHCKVNLTEDAISKINQSREYVDQLVESGEIVYGITTGFGDFSSVHISKDQAVELQRNLIISHACGVGNHFSEEVTRAIILLRLNNLAKGFSGIRLSTMQVLVDMLNKGLYPAIPEKGSLGASGDLAPLAHMVLPMIGEGEAYYKGKLLPGAEAMKEAGIQIIELVSKEGLALINGTQVMTAAGALTCYDSINLMKLADISASLSIEALQGITDPFIPELHALRPHQGQINSAKNLLSLLNGSERTTRQGEIRVQDAYSLRCVPQVHGASWDTFNYVKNKIEIEINSVTDNPIIFPEKKLAISGGHFHGQPMALPFDFLGIAIAEIANISERRIERLVNPSLNNDLPAFLTQQGGLHSGFMITQYVAAALVSENKVLAHPASVDSIPSSANQEDHVSMGTIAARKAQNIYQNTKNVIAIELLAATQAIDLATDSSNKKLGKGTQIAYNIIRDQIEPFSKDRVMYPEINKAANIIDSESIVNSVEKEIGQLL